MHSNNDLMPADWKPSPQSDFRVFMNAKKTKYYLTHEGTFNTVHVTEWAEEFVVKLNQELAAAKAEIAELSEDAMAVYSRKIELLNKTIKDRDSEIERLKKTVLALHIVIREFNEKPNQIGDE